MNGKFICIRTATNHAWGLTAAVEHRQDRRTEPWGQVLVDNNVVRQDLAPLLLTSYSD